MYKLGKIILLIIPLGLLILLFSNRNELNNYISGQVKLQLAETDSRSIDKLIDSLYNYNKGSKQYKATIMEFGAMNCVACRKMSKVLNEIKDKYHNEVNVVFLNIMLPENQRLMKYYGISAIPTQIFLSSDAKEHYRHTGFISVYDIDKELKVYLNKNQ